MHYGLNFGHWKICMWLNCHASSYSISNFNACEKHNVQNQPAFSHIKYRWTTWHVLACVYVDQVPGWRFLGCFVCHGRIKFRREMRWHWMWTRERERERQLELKGCLCLLRPVLDVKALQRESERGRSKLQSHERKIWVIVGPLRFWSLTFGSSAVRCVG